MPAYTEAAAERLEKKGWVRVDIDKIWKAKKRKMARAAVKEVKKSSDTDE